MLAHERALDWQELFDLAARTSMDEDDIVATGYRIAGMHSIQLYIWMY
jgi:elongator complex protein 1